MSWQSPGQQLVCQTSSRTLLDYRAKPLSPRV
jgi:hypothetical protein